MGLRMKVFSGFAILAGVLVVAGAWSIYELKRVDPSVQHALGEGHATGTGVGEQAAVGDLLEENDGVADEIATALRNGSSRAALPGIVAVAAALVFTLILYFFVNFYVVGPVIRMHEAVERFLGNDVPFDVEVETNDELAELARDIQRLCARIEPGEGER